MTIDWWTLGIEAVNVLILIWLLKRFFWRPIATMIATRRAAAQQLLDEAQGKRDEATAAAAEIEATRAGFQQERVEILAAAHAAAELVRCGLLDEAKTEAGALKAAAIAEIGNERTATEQSSAERASRLAIDIASRLAARLDGPAVRAAFLEWLIAEIEAMPEPARHAVAANGGAIGAVSATPLDPVDEECIRKRIGTAFGAQTTITFSVDPGLIAGIELHGPHLSVKNSWSADLSRISAELLDGK